MAIQDPAPELFSEHVLLDQLCLDLKEIRNVSLIWNVATSLAGSIQPWGSMRLPFQQHKLRRF